MKQLLAPLQKLANLIEDQNKKVDEIHSVLTVDLVKASEDNMSELKTQTLLLADIKLLLQEQSKQGILRNRREERGGRFRMKAPDLSGAATVGLAVISMAGALLISAGLFKLMPVLNPMALLSALAVALIVTLITPAFVKIAESLKGMNQNEMIAASLAIPIIVTSIVVSAGIFMMLAAVSSKLVAPDSLWTLKAGLSIVLFGAAYRLVLDGIKGLSIKDVLLAGAAIPVIAAGAVAAGLIFMLGNAISSWVSPPPEWTLKAGLAVALFSIPFGMVIHALTKKVSIKDITLAGLALPAIALGLIGTAWIFSQIPIDEWVAPPIDWTLKTGLAVALFAAPFALIASLGKSLSFKSILMGTLALPLIAAAILGAAWIFSYLPENFIAPPLDWAVGAALALTAFAIPFAIMAALATALTPLGIVLGAAGIILLAGSMWVVAWIFSKMPDLTASSKNLTDALMYPVNSMIDALKRVNDEIGVDNLLPLAGGLLAIAGSWLALTAALAGQAAGGLVSSVANLGSAIIDGIGSLFGGEGTKSPIDLLDMLIDRQAGIQALADPVKILGDNFANMSQYTEAVITGVTAFSPFLDVDNANNFTKSAGAATTLALAYEKMSKASQTMNVMAITESTKMFEALARIAEADGEDAITAISEKLMEAVKQLSETVENLQEANDQNSTSIQDTISSTIGGFIDKIKGTTDSAGQSESGLVDVAPIVAAIQELEDRLNRPIRVEEV